jgi:hypothetical protein
MAAEPLDDREPVEERADTSEAVELTEKERSSGGQLSSAESGVESRVRGGEGGSIAGGGDAGVFVVVVLVVVGSDMLAGLW